MSTITNVSRRGFLTGLMGAGAFVLSARYIPQPLWAEESTLTAALGKSVLHPDIFLGIETDGTVHIVAHRSEMGTTTRTSLPLVAADELDADWNRVRIEQAIGDPKYGDQNTDGSKSIRDFYEAFREAGAAARTMLVSAAAAQWNVPPSECVAANHEVQHKASGRKLGYGALVPAASRLPVPKRDALRFKTKDAWRYIGKERPIYDLTDITTGKAAFGLDVYRDGMVHASIEHPPVFGGKARSVD